MSGKVFFKFFFAVFLLLSVPLGIILVSQKTNFFQRAFGESANIMVDASIVTNNSNNGSWKNLAQGGEEKGRPLVSVIQNVAKLDPNYIRVDHIFDFYPIANGDWGEFDGYMNDIRAVGAIPLISLSYMPSSMAKNGDITEVPNNWVEWENLVQKTVEHISGKNGLNFNNVYYEVWNEPDLFGKFKPRGDKNYLDLYIHTVNGATRSRGVNNFKIGGPATTNFYKTWMDAMLNLKNQGVRVDFLSWHKYSKNLDDFEKDVKESANYQGVELLVTETGINSENDSAYDGNLAGYHTIASSAVYEGVVSKVFAFEIKDGPNSDKKYWGRWGILTHDKHGVPEEKPRFKALQFMNNMKGQEVATSGNGSWVKAFSKKDGNNYKVLVVNFDPSGKHSEAVPITVKNLPFDNYSVRRINFMGTTTNTPVLDRSNTWSAIFEFAPNSASIFEIIPK